jgi:hypothetical protein
MMWFVGNKILTSFVSFKYPNPENLENLQNPDPHEGIWRQLNNPRSTQSQKYSQNYLGSSPSYLCYNVGVIYHQRSQRRL